MIKLSDWNEAINYGQKICEQAKNERYDVKLKPYTLYDGSKGLCMQVFDFRGNLHMEYATGIHDDLKKLKLALEDNIRKIKEWC